MAQMRVIAFFRFAFLLYFRFFCFPLQNILKERTSCVT